MVGVGVLFAITAIAVMPTGYEPIGFGLAGIIVVLTAGIIYVCPNDRAPLAWMKARVEFQMKPKRLTQHARNEKHRTQSLTDVESVYQIQGAIKRDDGTLVGAIKVDGRDMALAETPEWEDAANGFESLANSLDSGFEIYSPATVVISHALVRGYRDRHTHDDVTSNDTLAGLIDDYQDVLPRELRNRGASTRDFYVIVWVTKREVRRANHGVLAKLSDVPGIGGAIARVGLARQGPTDAEILSRQKSMLSARKRAVENGISSIEGCSAEPVDAEHLTAIIKEFWTGRRTRKSGKPIPKHQLPVVARGADSGNPADTGGY
jgi:hypothetical protein